MGKVFGVHCLLYTFLKRSTASMMLSRWPKALARTKPSPASRRRQSARFSSVQRTGHEHGGSCGRHTQQFCREGAQPASRRPPKPPTLYDPNAPSAAQGCTPAAHACPHPAGASSPAGPKPEPGVVTMSHFSRISANTSHDFWPARVAAKPCMNRLHAADRSWRQRQRQRTAQAGRAAQHP